MYNIKLTTSYFSPQSDTEIRDITVGELLRETACGTLRDDSSPSIRLVFVFSGMRRAIVMMSAFNRSRYSAPGIL